MTISGTVVAALAGWLAISAGAAQQPAAPHAPAIHSEADEIVMALGAAPESLRRDAGVWVLGKDGYRQVRPAANGLTCLVEHERTDTNEPICWDPEGTATIMPVVLERARLRAHGAGDAEVARKIADGFADGTFRAPRRPGIAYMMSAHNYVFNGQKVIHFGAHVMAYAPYLRNADIGSTGNDPNAPWILNEGSPHAYIIMLTK